MEELKKINHAPYLAHSSQNFENSFQLSASIQQILGALTCPPTSSEASPSSSDSFVLFETVVFFLPPPWKAEGLYQHPPACLDLALDFLLVVPVLAIAALFLFCFSL